MTTAKKSPGPEITMLRRMQETLQDDLYVFLYSHEESRDKAWSQAFATTCLAYTEVSKRLDKLGETF